jgi:hypothetical protein
MTQRVKNATIVATETVANETVANETVATETVATETAEDKFKNADLSYVDESEILDGLSAKAYKKIRKIETSERAQNGKKNVLKLHYSLLNAIEDIFAARTLPNVAPFAEVLGLAHLDDLTGSAKKEAKAKALKYVSYYTFSDNGLIPLRKRVVIDKSDNTKYIVFVACELDKYDYLKDICNNIAKYLVNYSNVNVKVDNFDEQHCYQYQTIKRVCDLQKLDNVAYVYGEIVKVNK